MNLLVRRSNLLVAMSEAGAVANAWKHNADAITLDVTGNAGRKNDRRAGG